MPKLKKHIFFSFQSGFTSFINSKKLTITISSSNTHQPFIRNLWPKVGIRLSSQNSSYRFESQSFCKV